MSKLLPRVPLSYSNLVVPRWAKKDLCGEKYFTYISWLAGYLWRFPIPLTKPQKRYIDGLRDKTPDGIALMTAEYLALFANEEEILSGYVEERLSFDEAIKRFRAIVTEFHREADLQEDVEESMFTPEEYNQIVHERAQLAILRDLPPHMDIGVRGILSEAAHQCKDFNQVVQVITTFFRTYSSQISK